MTYLSSLNSTLENTSVGPTTFHAITRDKCVGWNVCIIQSYNPLDIVYHRWYDRRMAKAERRAKDAKMAAALIAAGYPHGRRRTSGLSNIPKLTDVGSAAYRRMKGIK